MRNTIQMIKLINSALISFRSCFSRGAAFQWFVTMVVGMMIRTDKLGATSIIRALGLKPSYEPLINYFRSEAWKLRSMENNWAAYVKRNVPDLLNIDGAAILAGDSIKVAKEGKRMAGVKRLHQESENTSKSEYIYGQLFGCVGVLAGHSGKTYCLPLACELQDGIKEIMSWDEILRQGSQTVEMISLAHRMAKIFPKAVLLLDRYYLSVPALERLDALNASGGDLRAIIMAKSNVVAYELPEARDPGTKGRPRIKGAPVKLSELFATEADRFVHADAVLYGKKEPLRYLSKELLWGKELYRMMRFVLVEFESGKRAIISSTDSTIDPLDIINLYARRFSIESTFKSMKHDVAAFSNRFWSKHMPKLKRYTKSGEPDRAGQVKTECARKCVRKSLDATEGYIFCGVVATGLLQMLSLRNARRNDMQSLRYLRTASRILASEATVGDYLRKNIFRLLSNEPNMAISQIIHGKMSTATPDFEYSETG